ncbi:DUF1254 domain-containing protein [Cellulomonas endometrii]|uniref:DUF1254 domain-containing protein n=1 Tax=Cellulomonas endometrii TaxID=3036301 RepID=UPI0024AE6067|nr:DUF1254 domain-containing protein [Cellulomonas endometrii]
MESAGVADAGRAVADRELADAITTPDRLETSLGTLEFTDGAPSRETVAKVYDNLDLMHGIEAFLNAYQGASVASLFKGFHDAGVPDNTALIWSEMMDGKSQFLTANADTVYFWINLDLGDGPLVLETPPMSPGVVDDIWWHWVTDFGLPGPDRGEGGRYLFVPPDYDGELPEGGFFVCRLRATRATVLGRSFLQDDDPEPTVALIKKTLKAYPYLPGGYGTSIASALAGEATLRRTPEHELDWSFLRPAEPIAFTEGSGKVMSTIPPNDVSFFDMINDVVQHEPAGSLDPEIMGSLAAVGIVKGRPFSPDARMKRILTDAAAIGTATSRALNWNARESENFYYYPDSAWMNMLFAGGYEFETPPPEVSAEGVVTPHAPTGYRVHNARTAMFFYATGITPAMVMKLTGIGSTYVGAFRDVNGDYFDGSTTYRVTLPPDIPAARFWSLTVYDNQSRSMLDTPQRFPRAGSQSYPTPAAIVDPDGSTTVFFGPSKPEGVSDGNWIQTVPGKGWSTILRLYSPLEPFFAKTWRPGEIEPED